MNREILFRGKRIDNGDWVEGDLVHLNGKVYVFPQDGLDSADRYEVIPGTVGQLTGLTDKNCKIQIWRRLTEVIGNKWDEEL